MKILDIGRDIKPTDEDIAASTTEELTSYFKSVKFQIVVFNVVFSTLFHTLYVAQSLYLVYYTLIFLYQHQVILLCVLI